MCLGDGLNDFIDLMKWFCYFIVYYYQRYFFYEFIKKNEMYCKKIGFRIEINLVEVNMLLVELIYCYYMVLNYQLYYVKELWQGK